MARVKSIAKKRFAVGAEVLVIMPGETGVIQLDHEPTILGEHSRVGTREGQAVHLGDPRHGDR